MKKNNSPKVWKGWRVISIIMMAVLLIAEGLLFFQIWKLKMLPMKFFAPILVVVALIDVALVLLMFPRTGKWQKSSGAGKRVTSYILSLAIAIGCLFGWKAVAKGNETLENITTLPTIAAQVGVYVMAEDKAQKIEDTAGYTFAITNLRDKDNTQIAIEGIEKIMGNKIKTKVYNTFDEMADALYSGKVHAMILNVAYAGLYDDSENFSDFSTRTRVVYEHNVEKKALPTTVPTQSNKPTRPNLGVKKTPFIVYLSGSDTRSSTLTDSISRSDVNILAVVHPETKQILLVNTPRDYYIYNAAYGVKDKLTHCGLDGMENSMAALSELYNCHIDYNAQINFTGFETLIDAVGGVNIYSEEGDGVFLSAGDNFMDGETALAFARERYSYADGDNARGRHQMQVITAVVSKLSSGAIISNYSDILDSLQGMFTTSIPGDTIRELIQMQLNDMATWDIHSYAVTGTGGTDSTIGGMAYVMYPDLQTVDHASMLINRVLDGGKITDADIGQE